MSKFLHLSFHCDSLKNCVISIVVQIQTQIDSTAKDKETQIREPDTEQVEMNERGEIVPEFLKTIVEIKFSHDVQSWYKVRDQITEKLRLKMIGKPWLANNGAFQNCGIQAIQERL